MSADAEIVPLDNLAEIEALDPAGREVAVTRMLSESRSWLAHAVESSGPREIAEFKAFVATVAETTKQLNLSKEIQLDAQEMVRRAERGVGLAIRKGQAEDQIATTPEMKRYASQVAAHQRSDATSMPEKTKPAPSDLVGRAEIVSPNSVYDMTDHVTDEQFHDALTEAKDEGNLSRANVVRKIKDEPPKPSTRPEHLRGTRHFDPVRAIAQTVYTLDGTRSVLERLEPHHFDALDPAEVDAWVSSLTDSLRSLNRLHRQLKELHQA